MKENDGFGARFLTPLRWIAGPFRLYYTGPTTTTGMEGERLFSSGLKNRPTLGLILE